ncbi:glycosyltransferase family protein [Histidinibacterium aquaticum]|uniref:Uncharacterized protein n=1 Tax=Histidinibacterium aquaticum TaxID=2613962 RepID=A0A5J5GJ85_9RHOB|nr:hypothetical protein [Histidinibacterium aquaticum]KAA9008301.1 hypothetical protein F3S47_12495 [Histidinibacterium aquaticum]
MRHHEDLRSFLRSGALKQGPVALVLVEDEVEVDSTLRHHLARGFRTIVAFAPPAFDFGAGISAQEAERLHRVDHDTLAEDALTGVVNACIAAAPGTWMHYGYNAEYLFYPFCETRTVGELAAFATEERRESVLTYVVDLYARDLQAHPSAVSIQDAHLDVAGYYALNRTGRDDAWLDRQMDFFGGLRWRFEEHIPKNRRRIDRISLFRAKPGLTLLPDHRLSDEEMNTYACPWHHSPTAAVCSFRTAKALKRNPGSTFDIPDFHWRNSAAFSWESRQLLDLGLMEPGQWF